jgi:hypothetical protein
MNHKTKLEIGMKNDSLRREVALLYVKQQMREEMVLAWEDFFEKNPSKRKEEVWQRIEERLRNKQKSKDQDKGVRDLKETQEATTQRDADHLVSKGSTEAAALGRREKIAALILKRRIWWEPVPGASSYVVYVSKDRPIFEPASFLWDRTPGIISKVVIGKTDLVIPDGWPEFPTESGTYYIGITSRDDIGNQSIPLLLSGVFKFHAPSAPLRGGIEYLTQP